MPSNKRRFILYQPISIGSLKKYGWEQILTFQLFLTHSFQVFVVGHDWGAMVAWHLCMIRPDLVKALVNLSVVFDGRHPIKQPIDSIKAVFGEDHYIIRFQVCKSMIFEANKSFYGLSLLIRHNLL